VGQNCVGERFCVSSSHKVSRELRSHSTADCDRRWIFVPGDCARGFEKGEGALTISNMLRYRVDFDHVAPLRLVSGSSLNSVPRHSGDHLNDNRTLATFAAVWLNRFPNRAVEQLFGGRYSNNLVFAALHKTS
jgi:hypothetical protein